MKLWIIKGKKSGKQALLQLTNHMDDYILKLKKKIQKYESDRMKKLVIQGNKELTGEIKISGAKNSVVALIPEAILSDESVTLYNVPNISDTNALIDIIKLLNEDLKNDDDVVFSWK